MSYDYRSKKITVVLLKGLETGIALNVTGHLSLAIGAKAETDIMGRTQLIDRSGIIHYGISKYPLIITSTTQNKIREAVDSAHNDKDILMVDYPKQMLETGHDDELNEAIARTQNIELEYLGAIFYGPTEKVNELTRKFSLWR